MPAIPDLTDQTYQLLTWIIGGLAVMFGVVGALYYLSDLIVWFRQTLASLWDNTIGQWFDQ